VKARNYIEIDPVTSAPGVGAIPAGVVMRKVIGKEDGASFTMRVVEDQPAETPPHGLHTHPWEHQAFVVSGQGAVIGETAGRPLRPGDVVFIPGGEPHTFANRGSEPFVFVDCISTV